MSPETGSPAGRVTFRLVPTNRYCFAGGGLFAKKMYWSVLLMDQVVSGRIVLHYANADWLGVLLKLEILPPPPRPISQKIGR